MLYWEMKLEKNATYQAGCDWTHSRTDLECRSEVYAEALAQLQAAVALFGFSPERDIISIGLRVYGHPDPAQDHSLVASWSTSYYGDIKPLSLGMLGITESKEAA